MRNPIATEPSPNRAPEGALSTAAGPLDLEKDADIPGTMVDPVEDPTQNARNGARFDFLCATIRRAALPFMRRALIRETASGGADALLRDFRSVCGFLGIEQGAHADDGLRAQLEAALATPSDVTDEEVARETEDFVQQVALAWVDALTLTLSELCPPNGAVECWLDSRLEPLAPASDPWRNFRDMFSRFPLDRSEVDSLLEEIAHGLFSRAGATEVELSHRIRLRPEWSDSRLARVRAGFTSR